MFNLRTTVLIVLRDGDSFGVSEMMDLENAENLIDDGTLDSYDYWKVISFWELFHTKGKKLVLREKSFVDKE